jgi:cell division protein FtsB
MTNVEPPDDDSTTVVPEPLRARRRRELASVEAKRQRNRLLSYVALAISGAFMVNALVGDKGFLDTIKAKRDYARVMAAITRLRTENARMEDESRRLHNDPSAIETVARQKLGLIRPGETLVIITNAKDP